MSKDKMTTKAPMSRVYRGPTTFDYEGVERRIMAVLDARSTAVAQAIKSAQEKAVKEVGYSPTQESTAAYVKSVAAESDRGYSSRTGWLLVGKRRTGDYWMSLEELKRLKEKYMRKNRPENLFRKTGPIPNKFEPKTQASFDDGVDAGADILGDDIANSLDADIVEAVGLVKEDVTISAKYTNGSSAFKYYNASDRIKALEGVQVDPASEPAREFAQSILADALRVSEAYEVSELDKTMYFIDPLCQGSNLLVGCTLRIGNDRYFLAQSTTLILMGEALRLQGGVVGSSANMEISYAPRWLSRSETIRLMGSPEIALPIFQQAVLRYFQTAPASMMGDAFVKKTRLTDKGQQRLQVAAGQRAITLEE